MVDGQKYLSSAYNQYIPLKLKVNMKLDYIFFNYNTYYYFF